MGADGMSCARRATRVVLEALLLTLVAGALALVGLGRLAPALGHPVFIIRSGSMTPTIPVGGAVVLDQQPTEDIRVGDVVALRLDGGAIFTHRITRLASLQGVPYVETKGDANASVDASLTPVDHIVGRVSLTLPVVGFLMAGLATPVGFATVLLAALTLVLALWMLDEDGAGAAGMADSRPTALKGRHARLLRWAR
jgi:signal peptidase I